MKELCLWSRIPKTASTSLHERILEGTRERRFVRSELSIIETPKTILFTCGHRTPDQIIESGFLSEETIKSCHVISVVRNPWARWVSLWFGIGREYQFAKTFEEFVLRSIDDPTLTCSDEKTPVGLCMKDWLTIGDYPLPAHMPGGTVIRMERLDKDFPRIADRLGIDPRPLEFRNGHNHRPYYDYHTQKTINAIADHEKWFLGRYPYEFGEDAKISFLKEGVA